MISGPEPPQPGLSKHRLEMLTDGVYAIAITLLVLELKVPDHAAGDTRTDLLQALGHLIPKFVAWLISFFVLCIFWIANYRMFLWVRSVDMKAMWITLLTLLGASFFPFASALVGEHAGAFVSQAVYASDMAFMGLMTLWLLGHLERHPELASWEPRRSRSRSRSWNRGSPRRPSGSWPSSPPRAAGTSGARALPRPRERPNRPRTVRGRPGSRLPRAPRPRAR